MPKIVKIGDLLLFFWIGEDGEPIYVHVAKGKPTPNATKIWLTRSGGCLLANNGSKLSKRELGIVLEYVTLNHLDICNLWKKTFHGDISFYK